MIRVSDDRLAELAALPPIRVWESALVLELESIARELIELRAEVRRLREIAPERIL